MLAVSPLRSTTRDEGEREGEGEMESFFMGGNEFPDFSSGNLLESIDFDDLFVGIEDGDLLPDLEMDSEMFSEFSSSGGEELEGGNSGKLEEGEKVSGLEFGPGCGKGEEIVSKREESVFANPSKKVGDKARKSSAHSKNPQGKRKVKVDWTPELHRRFVQAVEQLGVDKAVPSRILELMGIGCLTRHNIASHLQKYRSHRKHLLAREAEAANWSHRRQIYGGNGGGGGSKISMISPWLAPTIGFPPANPAAMTPLQPHFRPLQVWGHPSAEQPLMHLWPKHQVRPLPPPPPPAAAAWAPTPLPSPARPPPDPSFWLSHHHRVPSPHTPGTPYFPPPLPTTRFPAPPPVLVPGIPPPPHAMYRSVVDPAAAAGAPIGVPTRQTGPHPPLVDFHLTTKESIDSALGDVLSKPWLPLPLGLKPPSHDSVLVELQRLGVPKIPPASCA